MMNTIVAALRSEALDAAMPESGWDTDDPPDEWVRRNGRPPTHSDLEARLWNSAADLRSVGAAVVINNIATFPLGADDEWAGLVSLALEHPRWTEDHRTLVGYLCEEVRRVLLRRSPLSEAGLVQLVGSVFDVDTTRLPELIPLHALAKSLKLRPDDTGWDWCVAALCCDERPPATALVPSESIAILRAALVSASDRVQLAELVQETGLAADDLNTLARKVGVPATDASPFVGRIEADLILAGIQEARRRNTTRPHRSGRTDDVRKQDSDLATGAEHTNHITYVIIDGTNVAMERSTSKPLPSYIDDAVAAAQDFFPRSQVQVYVDRRWFHTYAPAALNGRERGGAREAGLVQERIESGIWVVAPAATRGKADGAVLRAATEVGGVVVSNDQFRDHHDRFPWIHEQPGRLWVAFQSFGRWVFEVADVRPQ